VNRTLTVGVARFLPNHPSSMIDREGVDLVTEGRSQLEPGTRSGGSSSPSRSPVESALYFCCLEALQNVAKYAHATHADVRLSVNGQQIAFEVVDDGGGFDLTPPREGPA